MKNEEKKTKELPRVYISGAITSVGYDNAKDSKVQRKGADTLNSSSNT